MSDLSDTLETALLDAVSDRLPGPVTGFVALVDYIGEDGETMFCVLDFPDQRIGTSLGMAAGLHIFYDESARRNFFVDD